MAKDPVLARELKSLHEEISALRRERAASPPDIPVARETKAANDTMSAASAGQPEETAEDQHWQAQLRELVDEAGYFFKEAEKNVSAHPTASLIGALVVGILIGRQLPRR